jgi:hypothetical protein
MFALSRSEVGQDRNVWIELKETIDRLSAQVDVSGSESCAIMSIDTITSTFVYSQQWMVLIL